MQSFYTKTSVKVPLKIGILMKSFNQPNWVRLLLKQLNEVDYLRLDLIIFASEAERQGLLAKFIYQSQYLLFFLYKRIDRAWLSHHRTNMTKLQSIEELVKVVPVLPLQYSHNNYTNSSNDEIQKVQSFCLDVILCLDECLLDWQDCSIARYGLWTLQDRLPEWPDSDGPAGFWEVIEHQSVTKCSLKMWSGKRNMGKDIFQSFVSTNPDSVTLNRSNYFSKMTAVVLRELRLLWEESGSSSWQPMIDEVQADPGVHEQRGNLERDDDDQLPKSPTNRKLIIPLLQHCSRIIKRRIENKFFNHQWFLAFSFQDKLKDFRKLTDNYTEILPPPDRFWADPFPVYQDGKYYLFFEELLFSSGKGRLSVMELQENGTWTTPQVVLEQDYHLSYPFMFKWQGTNYMIPETSRKKSIELYKCTEWPTKWKFEKVLMTGVNASDTTICEIEGLWWMFVAMAVEGTQAKDGLFLYYSENPTGPWLAHKKNPVVSDVRSARPAGGIFQSGGVWLRPAQDCSGLYGRAIALMEIVCINPHEYFEKEYQRIEPVWSKNLIGTHTLNIERSLTVIDGCRKRLKRMG